MQLKDVISRIGPVSPKTRLREAAHYMRALNLPVLPVCEGRRLIGLITPRDLTMRATAQGCDPEATPVQAVMTREIVYGEAEQEINEAVALMRDHGLTSLLVVDRQHRLVGIVALADLQRYGPGIN